MYAHPCVKMHASTHLQTHTLAHGHTHTPTYDIQPMAHLCISMRTSTRPCTQPPRTQPPQRIHIFHIHQCVTHADLKLPGAGALDRGRPISTLQFAKLAGPRQCPDSSALGTLWGVAATKALAQMGQNCVNSLATQEKSLRKVFSKSDTRYNLR